MRHPPTSELHWMSVLRPPQSGLTEGGAQEFRLDGDKRGV